MNDDDDSFSAVHPPPRPTFVWHDISRGLVAFAEMARQAARAREQRHWRGVMQAEVSRQRAKKEGR